MIDSLPSVEWNPWLACAMALSARWFIPGMALAWALNLRVPAGQPAWILWVFSAAGCLIAGLLSSVLITWLLAEAGLYIPAAEWTVIAAVTALGVCLGVVLDPQALHNHLRHSLPGLIVFATGIAVLMSLPRRGEWILGGWDPGVYINQGAVLAQQGTFHPGPSAAFRDLSKEEFGVFSRRFNDDYVEVFPGTPLDPDTRSFRFYFFRATPCLMAATARSGGLRAETRINGFLGLAVGVVFLALMLRAARRPAHALFAALLLAVQPAFLYHLHTPLPEMAELFFICAAGFLWLKRPRSWTASSALALVLFAATLNRLSFAAYAVLLILLLAVMDLHRSDRRRVGVEHALMLAAVGGALGFDLATSAMIPRLGHVLPFLLGLCGAGVAAVAGVDAAASIPFLRSRLKPGRTAIGFALAAGGALAGVTGWLGAGVMRDWCVAVQRIGPFIGWPLLAAATAGGVLLILDRLRGRSVTREMGGFLLWLFIILNAILLRKWVADLYPWATRRFLSCSVPLVAALAAALPAGLRERGKANRWMPLLSLAMLAAIVAGTARQSWHAWRRTEYDGASAALKQIAERIRPGDVVVADHFWWATPLTFIYDRPALDGSPLWERDSPRNAELALAALRRLSRGGQRIRLLTSAGQGIPMYLTPLDRVTQDWRSAPVLIEEIVHHPRAADYEVRTRKYMFELFTWDPANEHAQ